MRVVDPKAQGVRMGPLATRAQLERVAAGIDKLRGFAEFAHGDGSQDELHEVEGGKGYFISPTLLRAKSAEGTDVVHEHEVFGPVATVIPYSGDAAEAVALVQRGQGGQEGLVTSIYSDDRAFVEEVVLSIAPFHGRLSVGRARVTEHSPGPGTVMPAMVHGGPGRAGGGEELGGLRCTGAYMQRTAVQGAKPLLQKVLDAVE